MKYSIFEFNDVIAFNNFIINKLSQMTAISRRHISEMENSKQTINQETAKQFAEVL